MKASIRISKILIATIFFIVQITSAGFVQAIQIEPVGPAAPKSITVPTSDTDGMFNISWTGTLDSNSWFVLQQKYNSGSYTTIYSGIAKNKSVTGLSSGSYVYRIRVCNDTLECSSYIYSNTIAVAVNTSPTISNITNKTISEDSNTGNVAFTIGDQETAASSLILLTSSNNTTLVPLGNIVLGGSGANRTIKVTPTANKTGTATITVAVFDGELSNNDTFVVTVNAVNDAPTISNISNKTINEDNNTGNVAFTIGDLETATTLLTLSKASSNTGLVPTGNIVFGGSGANRTVKVTPAANKSGSVTITVTVSDGALTKSDTFVVTVNAVNDAPTISNITNKTINEDSNTGNVAFTIGDLETATTSLSLSRSSSNTALVPTGNIVFGGSGANRTTKVTPVANKSGTATITMTVSDGALTRSDSFVVTVNAVNDAPTISNITNKTINEDSDTGSVTFTIGDQETDPSLLTLSKSSSNTALVPISNIALGGVGASRKVKVTPVANKSGTATITVTVSDGALTKSDTFVVTVNAVNDAPTISNITDRSINEDSNTGNVAFTIGDQETATTSLTLSKASSNTALVPTGNIVFGGSGANRTVKVTPVANKSGTATITVTVSDGALTKSDTFVVTVNAVNDAPTISNITNKTINEDSNTGNVAFTIGDLETATTSLILSKASSNTTLVPTGNIVFGGSGANRTVKVTPAANKSGTATITVTVSDGALTKSDTFVVTINAVNDAPTISNITNKTINEDSNTGNVAFTIGDLETATTSLTLSKASSNTTLVPTGNIVFGGSGANRTVKVTPAANKSGTATITVTVSDGGLTKSDTFVVTVNAVNDAPTISNITNKTINEDSNTGNVAFIIGDLETATTSLGLTRASSNTSLIPISGIVFGGSGANRTVRVTPVADKSGTATITVTVSDGALTTNDTFVVTVNAVNDAPTISNITNKTINEDSDTGSVTFTIGDQETDPSLLTLSKSSSNTALVPAGNIVLGGVGASRKVKVTPVANKNGTATITVTVSDGGLTKSDTFVVTVNAVNDAPTISNITNKTIDEDGNTGNVAFTIGDLETVTTSLILSKASSNTTLVPTGNIVFGGSGANRTIKVTPAANKSGTATITVTVSDGALTKTETFVVTVNAVNDAPTISNISNRTIDEDNNTGNITFTIGNQETATTSLILTKSSNNAALVPSGNVVLGGSGASRTVKVTPLANKSGSATITITVSDGSLTNSDTFVLTVNGVNDTPVITEGSSLSINGEPNSTITFSLSASDADSDLLTWSLQGVVSNGTVSGFGTGNSRSLIYTPNNNYEGSDSFVIRVADGITFDEIAVNADIVPAWANTTNIAVVDAGLISPIVPANQAIGAVEGQASVSGGSASYSIPINVAPGRANMQPSISLNYSSNGGNGIMGVGWSLSATSSISRCSSTLAQDLVSRSVQLDGNDKLCLNGQRLINTVGQYGESGTEYRTEMDSFATVTQSGLLGSSGVSFTVVTKSGSTDTYGVDSNSRVSPSGVLVEQSWLLSMSVDVTGNNHISYYYNQKGDGEVLIEDIYYTGDGSVDGDRRVEFTYAIRPDQTRSYHMGGLTRSRYRLTTITNTDVANGNSILWKYNLAYELNNSNVSDRSLLKNVETCGSNNQCLPPTQFNWRSQNLSATLEPMSFDGSMLYPDIQDIYAVLPHGDVNGDGVRDWSGHYVNAEGEYVEPNDSAVFPCYRRTYRSQPVCVDADVNRDGRTDDWRSNGGYLQIKYTGETTWRNTAVELDQATSLSELEDGHVKNVADYNGDSWPDLMVYRDNNSLPQLYLYLHSGNTNAPYNTSGQLIYQYSSFGSAPKRLHNGIQFQGDLDGNGRPDLVEIDTGINLDEFYPQPRPVNLLLNQLGSNVVFQSQPFNYAPLSATDDVYFSYFIDINGDGLSDWLGWKAVSGQQAHQLIARYNIGDGNFGVEKTVSGDSMVTRINYAAAGDGESYIETKYVRYSEAFKTVDINGDGRPEILTPGFRAKEACALISSRNNPPSKMCGEALYGTRYASEDLSSLVSIDSTNVDDSIYRFDALYFDEDSNGNLSLRRETTPFYGHAYQSTMVDAFGKGLVDLISLYRMPGAGFTGTSTISMGSYGVYISRNKGQSTGAEKYAPIDLMQSVTNGLGVNSSWIYRPLSTGTYSSGVDPFYEPNFDYTGQFEAGNGEYLHFSSSMYVVAGLSTDNGTGGQNQTRYRYRGAVYNTKGRSFQGYRTIIVDDLSNNDLSKQSRSVTDFHQTFPYAGKIESARTCLIADSDETCSASPISQTDILYGDKTTASNKVHWVIPTNSTSTSYDLADRTKEISQKISLINLLDTDGYGNVLKSNTTIDNGFTTVKTDTVNVYDYAQVGAGWFNKLETSTVTSETTLVTAGVHDSTLDPKKQIKTAYTWTTDRQPDIITVTPILPTLDGGKITNVDTDYNLYGLPTSVCTYEVTTDKRCITSSYSKDGSTVAADGYFVHTITNDLNHTVTTKVDPAHGQAIEVIDANGLTSTSDYDAFGRVEKVTPPLGTGQPAFSRFADCIGGCDTLTNPNIKYKVTTYQAGSPETTLYKDMFNRVLVAKTEGFGLNEDIYVLTDYDNLGRKTFESVPSFSTAETKGVHYLNYDALGRLTSKKTDEPQDGASTDQSFTVTYSYSGHTTNIVATGTSGTALTMSRAHSGTGQLMQTIDANEPIGGVTQYAYDSMGNPIVLQDANGNAIKAKYNALGQKLYVDDPNMGRKEFTYTGFGEVDTEKDANLDTTDYDYDVLGRLIERKVNTISEASFIFDSASCKGVLEFESRNDLTGGERFDKTYNYDGYCRPSAVITNIDGTPYTQSMQYDASYGRVKASTAPTGLTVQNLYNDKGYLTHSQNAKSAYVYQEVTEMDARLQLTKANKANGVLSERLTYAHETGQMTSIMTDTTLGGNQRHRIDYEYDDFGNLLKQTVENMVNSAVVTSIEDYQYDKLHRLTQSSQTVGTNVLTPINYQYDAVGNITSKDDFGNGFVYGDISRLTGNAGPNAVTSVNKNTGGTANYSYDNNGNMLTGDGKSMTYNAFNKPLSITKGTITSSFSYGSSQMRYKQVKSGKPNGDETTIYLDKAYEEITYNGETKKRLYLGDAIITESIGGTTPGYKIGFVHRDRLNSVVTITDENGNVVDNKSFDPFGKPRTGTFEQVATPTILDVANAGGFELHTTRGFTDHEHLDDAELIHMNGRIYDYNLGRFLSVDPFIHVEDGSQGINPYSYIMNNPLAGTDPSGYSPRSAGRPGNEWSRTRSLLGIRQLGPVRREKTTPQLKKIRAANYKKHIESAKKATQGVKDGLKQRNVSNGMESRMKNDGKTADLGSKSNKKNGSTPHEKGEAGVKASEKQAIERGEKVLGKEVTIKMENGKATKADILVQKPDGGLKAIESKNGPTAKLTPNQGQAQKELPEKGGEFRGKNAEKAGFKQGQKVDKIEFKVDKHNIELDKK